MFDIDLDKTLVKYLIEFGGAFALVFVMGRAIKEHSLENNTSQEINLISALYGAVVATLYFAFSEQHFNPWFTVQAFFQDLIVTKSRSIRFVVIGILHIALIWSLQLVGSIAGAAALQFFHNDANQVGKTVPQSSLNGSDIIFYEFAASFLYAIIVFCISANGAIKDEDNADDRLRKTIISHLALPVASGLSIYIATATVFSKTGASINFVRTIGPAIISKDYTNIGYIFLGQMIGYGAAGCIFNIRFMQKQYNTVSKRV
jgi:glycerol uptake facilitator-like aquaporin